MAVARTVATRATVNVLRAAIASLAAMPLNLRAARVSESENAEDEVLTVLTKPWPVVQMTRGVPDPSRRMIKIMAGLVAPFRQQP